MDSFGSLLHLSRKELEWRKAFVSLIYHYNFCSFLLNSAIFMQPILLSSFLLMYYYLLSQDLQWKTEIEQHNGCKLCRSLEKPSSMCQKGEEKKCHVCKSLALFSCGGCVACYFREQAEFGELRDAGCLDDPDG